jgi:hypothetical protein
MSKEECSKKSISSGGCALMAVHFWLKDSMFYQGIRRLGEAIFSQQNYM